MPMSAGRARRRAYDGPGMAPIVHHPDVQRTLLTMKALTQIARAISYSCAHAIDMARASPPVTAPALAASAPIC